MILEGRKNITIPFGDDGDEVKNEKRIRLGFSLSRLYLVYDKKICGLRTT